MLTISLQADVLNRFADKLAQLGDGQARVAFARALNHEGDKLRTQVRRTVARQTGIKYGDASRKIIGRKASPATLAYVIEGAGTETNIGQFRGAQTPQGVRASPWGKSHLFAHVFTLKAVKGVQGAVAAGSDLDGTLLAFVREGKGRTPIRPVFGPNLAREMVKAEAKAVFLSATPIILDRIGYEIERLLSR